MDTTEKEVDGHSKNELLEAALKYLSMGFSVVPLDKEDVPLVPPKEFHIRRMMKQEVDLYFSDPNAIGVGIVTGKISKLVVLETEKGADFSEIKISEKTPTVAVEGGKAQYYFRYPSGEEIPNCVRILPYMQIRGNGGYVVAPRSLNSFEKGAVWTVALDENHLTIFPQNIKDRILEQNTVAENEELVRAIVSGRFPEEGSDQDIYEQSIQNEFINSLHENNLRQIKILLKYKNAVLEGRSIYNSYHQKSSK